MNMQGRNKSDAIKWQFHTVSPSLIIMISKHILCLGKSMIMESDINI